MHREAARVACSWARKVLCKGNTIFLSGLLKEVLGKNCVFAWRRVVTAEVAPAQHGKAQ